MLQKSPFQVFIGKITRFAELVAEYPEILNEHGERRREIARQFVALTPDQQRDVTVQLFLGDTLAAAKAGGASEKLSAAWLKMYLWLMEKREVDTTEKPTGLAQHVSVPSFSVPSNGRAVNTSTFTVVSLPEEPAEEVRGASAPDARQIGMFPDINPGIGGTKPAPVIEVLGGKGGAPEAAPTIKVNPGMGGSAEPPLVAQCEKDAIATAVEYNIDVKNVLAMFDGTDGVFGKPQKKNPRMISATMKVPHWVICKILKGFGKMQKLSFVEAELIALRDSGLTNLEIAVKIGTDTHTVEKALRNRIALRTLRETNTDPDADPFAKPVVPAAEQTSPAN